MIPTPIDAPMAVPASHASNSWPVFPAQLSAVPATPVMIQIRKRMLMTTITQVNGLHLGISASVRSGSGWNGEKMYGVKWRNFKMVLVEQKYLTDPAQPLSFPHIVNLMTDPKEHEPFNPVHLHSWVIAHTGRLIRDLMVSLAQEPAIPAGAPLDHVPHGGSA